MVKQDWVGVVDCLGYLVCRACNESGRGHQLESYVFGPPHSEEHCDFCGYALVRRPGSDLRNILPGDWLEWTPCRGPQ